MKRDKSDSLTNKLLEWYNANRRILPWRNNPTPYNIWVSEIILQQTQMQRGIEYYLRFIARFPDVKSLSIATDEEVLVLWKGLGYYSRARNMLYAANQIMNEHNGKFPDTYRELRKLKGIGDYTACAILSIAYGQDYSVVDGNVKRIVSRLYDLNEPVENIDVYSKIKKIVSYHSQGYVFGEVNQALMDFGSIVCKPRLATCNTCPVHLNCKAFEHDTVPERPVRMPKQEKKIRYFNFFIIYNIEKNSVYVQKREQKDIWQGMYSFPLLESKHALSNSEIYNRFSENYTSETGIEIHSIAEKKHILTHQIIRAKFYKVNPSNLKDIPENWKEILLKDIRNLPFDNLMNWFIQNYQNEIENI